MQDKSVNKLLKNSDVATAKKPYTKPALKIYGAVSELTNGTSGSGYDCNWTRHAKSGSCH